MIFRRIKAHVEKENWFAVAASVLDHKTRQRSELVRKFTLKLSVLKSPHLRHCLRSAMRISLILRERTQLTLHPSVSPA